MSRIVWIFTHRDPPPSQRKIISIHASKKGAHAAMSKHREATIKNIRDCYPELATSFHAANIPLATEEVYIQECLEGTEWMIAPQKVSK